MDELRVDKISVIVTGTCPKTGVEWRVAVNRETGEVVVANSNGLTASACRGHIIGCNVNAINCEVFLDMCLLRGARMSNLLVLGEHVRELYNSIPESKYPESLSDPELTRRIFQIRRTLGRMLQTFYPSEGTQAYDDVVSEESQMWDELTELEAEARRRWPRPERR